MTEHRITVERLADGTAVVVKRSLTEAGATALLAEAALLGAVRRPGVVDLVRHDGGPPVEVATRYAGDRTLAHGLQPRPEYVVEIIAGVCEVVAALHRQGIVHGRLTPDHVILGEGGRPILCGFGGAGPEEAGRARADDVHAIGLLLRRLVDGEVDEEPIPDRRPLPWRPSPWSGYVRRALLTLADQATADDADRRPSAQHLAAALRTTMPSDRPSRPRRPRVLAAVAAALLVPVLAAAVAASGTPTAPTAARPSSTVVPTSVPATTTTSTTTPPLRPGRIQIGGATFRVGAPGDRLAIGDWDCDGSETLALLRPGSGEVYEFPDWDPTHRGTQGVVVGQAQGAVDLVTPDRCGPIHVRLAEGGLAKVGS